MSTLATDIRRSLIITVLFLLLPFTCRQSGQKMRSSAGSTDEERLDRIRLWLLRLVSYAAVNGKLFQADYLQAITSVIRIVQLVEVKDAVGRGYPVAVAMRREGEQLLKVTASARSDVSCFSADGKEMSSEGLANFIQSANGDL